MHRIIGKKAYIALGSNATFEGASPSELIILAVEALQACMRVTAISRFWQNPAYPKGIGPDFVNAVVRVEWNGTPNELLSVLHRIENDTGRIRTERWAARSLDMDLLAFEAEIIPDIETNMKWINLPPKQQLEQSPDALILPHPRLHERAFVLMPLSEIAADWIHPVLGQTAAELLAMCSQADRDEMVPLEYA